MDEYFDDLESNGLLTPEKNEMTTSRSRGLFLKSKERHENLKK